jgi:hypothetical protein
MLARLQTAIDNLAQLPTSAQLTLIGAVLGVVCVPCAAVGLVMSIASAAGAFDTPAQATTVAIEVAGQ